MNRKKVLNIALDKNIGNSAATVKMVSDLETKLAPYTKNNVYREIFEEFYDFSDASKYKLTSGSSSITFTGISPNITFPQMNIANVWEGGLRLKNQTLDLSLFSKRDFTVCVVMQSWLNTSMSIKTFIVAYVERTRTPITSFIHSFRFPMMLFSSAMLKPASFRSWSIYVVAGLPLFLAPCFGS